MRKKALIILFLFSSIYSFGQSSTSFSKEVAIADLEYLYASLQEAHYNLYAYTAEEEFLKVYQEVVRSLDQDSLDILEITNAYQRLVATADIGHTSVDFPGQSYGEYLYAGGTLFPLEIAFEYDRPLVRKNWSDNDNIKAGSEIISINGKPMGEILSHIYPLISAERPYFKNVKLECFSFPRYYWLAYGQQDHFEVQIRHDGITKTYSVSAIRGLEDFEMKREEVLNASMELKFYEQAAYLNPGDLSGDEQPYQRFIDSAFASIIERESQNLIIDLRNNQGGDDSFSDYLVSYIADQPFQWNASFTLKTSAFLKEHVRVHYDTASVFWQEALSRKSGEVYEYEFEEYRPQPKQKRFTGQVYVLVNRQSHSQSAVAAAQIQDYGFGTIVGEETGDYPSLYASNFQYALPNTGITVSVSKGYMVRVSGSRKEEGVIPDLFIKDHLLDEDDEILDGILRELAE